MFSGAFNAFRDEVGKGKNIFTGEIQPFSTNAREYKSKNIAWVAVGDENYGEGSSREHAAMEPRYLFCKVVVVRSFARIHETNLKKQGILALSFKDPNDYEKIKEDDRLSFIDLIHFAPGKMITMKIKHSDGMEEFAELKHTYNANQIEWFKAGSALNLIH